MRQTKMDSRETVNKESGHSIVGARTTPIALSALILVFAHACQALACSKPSFYATAPNAPGSFDKPDIPFCFRDHSCDEWQARNYISDVEDYVEELKRFAGEAIDFSNQARSFAEDALSYAKCEADDVTAQHR